MSNIRRQSIISSAVVYLGFALGFLNTYLFTRIGSGIAAEQYGLTVIFISFANIILAVAGLGMPAYIYKFYPYYNDRLPRQENDMLALALGFSTIGFLAVLSLGLVLKDVFIERFRNSPGIDTYYNWIFVFGFGLTLFTILEAYAWQQHKSVLTNFLKEVLFRLLITLLIAGLTLGLLQSFDAFIKLFAFLYLAIGAILLAYLLVKKRIALVFSISKVTRRFRQKIMALCAFVWTGGMVFTIASVFDNIVLALVLPNGLAVGAIFQVAQNITSLMQAPQRAIIAASIGPLSQAWKEKDYDRINRIYHRSSINQLIFSCAMFALIWLNFKDGVHTFRLKPEYLPAYSVFLLLGISRIIDMGTGVGAQIIGTSTFWKFEFVTGLLLFALLLPLNYVLTRYWGVIGPAIANLVSFTIYNAIRCFYLWRKFRMQPFTVQSLYTVLLAAAAFLVCNALFSSQRGFEWIVLRSALFVALFAAGAISLRLSPDLQPVLATIRKRLGFGR